MGIAEAKDIQAAHTSPHALRNDLGAHQMLKDLRSEGFPLSREVAMNCMTRMQISGTESVVDDQDSSHCGRF